MATTLTATPLPDQAAVRLYLESVDAVHTPVVMRDFTLDAALRDSETALVATSGLTKYPSSLSNQVNGVFVPFRHMVNIRAVANTTTAAYAVRPINGLTIGQRYRVSLSAATSGQAWLFGVEGIGSKTVHSSSSGVTRTSAWTLDGEFVYEFTATAVTHNVRISLAATTVNESYFHYSAIRVAAIPSGLYRFETDLPSSEDTNWSVVGTPVGATSTDITFTEGFESLKNRFLGRGWDYSSGTPDLIGASVRRTLTGPTVGKVYDIRISVHSLTRLYGTATNALTTVGIDGIGATDPTSWNTRRWVTYTFTATATSHVLVLAFAQPVVMGQTGDYARLYVDHLRVEQQPDAGPKRTFKSLVRSDANGSTSVRLFAGQTLTSGVLIVTDYESALAGLVTYTASVAVQGFAALEIAHASVTSVGTTMPVIAPATMPHYQRFVPMVTGYDSQRESATTVHQVVGRADPLVVLGPLRTRTGTLEMSATDYASARSLTAVYDRGEVVLLRQPNFPGLDMYHIALATRIEPDVNRWRVVVTYTETKNPVGPLLGSLGWTFDQAAISYSTFATAQTEFPTFNEYTLGPVG